MGNVTNIILVTGGEEVAPVDQLNTHLRDNTMVRGNALVQVDQCARGGKAMECDVYVAAVNYLPRDDLVAAFRACEWESPHCAQLLIKGEDDEVFVSYEVRP